jgi:PilZ domain
MSVRDRRSGEERRSTNRYLVELEIEWEGPAGRVAGTISDVSLDGCFVLSSGDIEDGENVKIFVPLADGMKVQFDGRVANHVFEIGFGIKFGPLSAAQRELLIQLVRNAEES